MAQSVYKDRSIHVVYTNEINPLGEHEDTHILTLEWGTSIGMFQEGLAEYMAEDLLWSSKPLADWLEEAIKLGFEKRIGELMSHQGWLDTPDDEAPLWYAISKSWIGFIFEKFGLDKFRDLYINMDREVDSKTNISTLEKITGVSFDELYTLWIRDKKA